MAHPRWLPPTSPIYGPPYFGLIHINSSPIPRTLLYLVSAAELNIVWRNCNPMLQLTTTTTSPPFQSLLSACLLSRWPSGRGGCARRALGRGACGVPGDGARSGGWRVAVLWAITPYPSPPQLSTLSGPSPALCLAGLPSSVVPLLPWLRARGVRLPRSAGLVGRSAGRRWLLGVHSITTFSTYSTSLLNSLTPHSYQLTKSYDRKPPVNIGL